MVNIHGVFDGQDQFLGVKTPSPMERFYLKSLEVETHGEYRSAVYQELARGFGATDYKILLGSNWANQTPLKTARELGRRMISGDGFAGSLVRLVLFAVHQTQKSEETRTGLNWFRSEIADYWGNREKVIHLLEYFKTPGAPATWLTGGPMPRPCNWPRRSRRILRS